MNGVKFLIPARKGSKGFPLKNRKLFRFTADIIPLSEQKNTIVTTDDEYIYNKAKYYNFIAHKRPKNLAQDTTSTKDVIIDAINSFNISSSDLIIMLYLTFPQRKYQDILNAIDFFNKHKADSLLCRVEPKSHPFVCMYADGLRGKQIIKHELYRRQDYPECFLLYHYICILKAKEINRLNKNLYNKNTIYYPIKDTVDVDFPEDLKKIL